MSTPRQYRLLVKRLDHHVQPSSLVDLLDELPGAIFFDSSAMHERFGRYSVLACLPADVLTLRENVLTNARGQVLADDSEGIWRALEETFASIRIQGRPADLGCVPGWFGFVSYETGRCIERLPCKARRDTALPDLRLAFHDAALVHDNVDNRWSLAWLEELGVPSQPQSPAALLLEQTLDRCISRASYHAPPRIEHADAADRPAASAVSNFTPVAYRSAVSRAIEYIAAGDIFQVNLSQRFTVEHAPKPVDIYRQLRLRNPAWYAAFMQFESAGRSLAILSSSPELFLAVRDGQVETRPIKGTRRRTGDPTADLASGRELWDSPKDNAELAMIIDLLRNDLGRVCCYGSVEVTQSRMLETHPTVLHLVGTVRGLLRPDVGPAGLLRATFPGGSITGAPKIRAMEIIDELEGLARGVYTGCIGTIGVDGSCQWNIAIRTIVCEGPASAAGPTTAHVQVGGGIVADSTPPAEYQETLDKARALLEAIEMAR